jgi:manganese transport protein
MIFAQPELDKVLFGLIPMPNEAALYIAGIIELVMPHIYTFLLVQTRKLKNWLESSRL